MKYIEWKGASDAGIFGYDELQEDGTYAKQEFKLDVFTIKSVGYTVRGFNADNKPMWSNDIEQEVNGRADWQTELKVSTKAEGTIYEGKYDKAKIENLGAKLHIKIVGECKGEDFTLYLKGKNYFNISQILKDIDTTVDGIKYTGSTDEKAGAVKYKAPVFEKAIDANKGLELADVPF